MWRSLHAVVDKPSRWSNRAAALERIWGRATYLCIRRARRRSHRRPNSTVGPPVIAGDPKADQRSQRVLCLPRRRKNHFRWLDRGPQRQRSLIHTWSGGMYDVSNLVFGGRERNQLFCYRQRRPSEQDGRPGLSFRSGRRSRERAVRSKLPPTRLPARHGAHPRLGRSTTRWITSGLPVIQEQRLAEDRLGSIYATPRTNAHGVAFVCRTPNAYPYERV